MKLFFQTLTGNDGAFDVVDRMSHELIFHEYTKIHESIRRPVKLVQQLKKQFKKNSIKTVVRRLNGHPGSALVNRGKLVRRPIPLLWMVRRKLVLNQISTIQLDQSGNHFH